MTYPLEAKLRRPVEWWSSLTCCTASAVIASHPTWLILPAGWHVPVAASLAGIGFWRLLQGLSVVSYQRNLRSLRYYALTPEEMPWSREVLFLGLGFQWGQIHTQRVADARAPEGKSYREPSSLYRLARRFERWAEHRPEWHQLITWTRSASPWNPAAPLPDVGGDAVLHGVEPNEEPVYTGLSNRVGHFLVLGTTRVGKTRLAEVIITQDIRRGDVVIVFDPKGDPALLRRMYAEAKRVGRDDAFYVFHLGYPDISARYNPVGEFARITEVATRTADPLPAEGNSAAFKEFVWRFVNVLGKAMFAIGERPDFQRIYEYAVDTEKLAIRYLEYWLDHSRPQWRDEFDDNEESLKRDKGRQELAKKTGRGLRTIAMIAYIREHELRQPLADALISVLSNDRTYFEKLVSSLYPLLEKLTTGKMAALISPDYDDFADNRPLIVWADIINRGGIVYVGLDSLTDHEVAGAVGTAMFADLTSVAGQIYKYGADHGQAASSPARKLALHADEFNELVGDTFVPMVNKAGGAGYQVTAYTQTWHDVEAKIGSAAKAQQIGGNFNSMIMLRVQNIETAELLTDMLPEVNIVTKLASSSVTDTNDPADFAEFGSKYEDRISTERVPMLTPADMVKLPKGQAFARIDGGQLWKIRIPLTNDANDVLLPPTLASMIDDMAIKYRKHTGGSDAQPAVVVEGKGSGW
jgi:conjugative coupling factor TraD (TOL family)